MMTASPEPAQLNIDWKVSNFKEEHRRTDAIKSPALTSNGAVWHIALAAGQQSDRQHVALYIRYKADPNGSRPPGTPLQLKFSLMIGGTDGTNARLTRTGLLKVTEFEEKFQSTFNVRGCVDFYPLGDFWGMIDQLCEPNGDLRVRADIQLLPPPPAGAGPLREVGGAANTAAEVSAVSPPAKKRVKTVVIPKGATVAVKGINEEAGDGPRVEWWLAQLQADILSDTEPRDSVAVRWWNRAGKSKEANAWKLDPPGAIARVLVATIHRDAHLFEMVKIGATQQFRVADEGSFDRLESTYGS